jgi:phosphopantetheine adenylyltransferase
MSLSEHEENIIVFVYLIKKQPNLFKEEERTNLRQLLQKLPDNVEKISDAIGDWCKKYPQIRDAFLNIPTDDLNSLRAANGRATPLTGKETKEIIENLVIESSESKESELFRTVWAKLPPKKGKNFIIRGIRLMTSFFGTK